MVTLHRLGTNTASDKRKNHKNLSLNLSSRRQPPPSTLTLTTTVATKASTPSSILHTPARIKIYDPPSQEPQQLSHYEHGPAQILPNLFLGACHTAEDKEILERHGISCIVNVAHEIHSDIAPHYVSSYHHLKWTHTQNNLARREFQRAIRYIETAHRANMNVLVHCQSGVERSAALMIAYILYLSRHSKQQAF
ncbi:protein-tyrosine phosphatase-like protein, partial [Phascolomyces articulosus]